MGHDVTLCGKRKMFWRILWTEPQRWGQGAKTPCKAHLNFLHLGPSSGTATHRRVSLRSLPWGKSLPGPSISHQDNKRSQDFGLRKHWNNVRLFARLFDIVLRCLRQTEWKLPNLLQKAYKIWSTLGRARILHPGADWTRWGTPWWLPCLLTTCSSLLQDTIIIVFLEWLQLQRLLR